MTEALDAVATARRLNHLEFAHRPGEGGLAIELLEALGCSCEVIDTPPYGKYIVVSLDGSPHGENDMFVSEVEPEQLALEEALQRQIGADASELAASAAGFRRLQRERPYRATHFGLRLPSVRALDDVIERLGALADGALKGRLELGYTMERSREEARSTSSPMKQIWVWTDVISTGLLAVGQQMELQAYDY
jgi:hypothetical protein